MTGGYERISITGGDYIGTVTGVSLGNEGYIVDIDKTKIDAPLNKGIPPLYEPGLKELLRKNQGRVQATDDLQVAVRETDIRFICEEHPMDQGLYRFYRQYELNFQKMREK